MKTILLFLTLVLVLISNLDTAYALKILPKVSGRVMEAPLRGEHKPLKFARVKICSTTKNIPCNEYITTETGVYFGVERENDTYNIHVNGVPQTTIEVKNVDVKVPDILIRPSSSGSSNKRQEKAAK